MKPTNENLNDIITAQNALIAQQAAEIRELSNATFIPSVIKDGVLVQSARVIIPAVKRNTQGVKWYEDKYIVNFEV